MTLILLILTHFSLACANEQVWTRTTLLAPWQEGQLRSEFQHRFSDKRETLNNVYRLTWMKPLSSELSVWSQLGVFNPNKGEQELRPALGLATDTQRVLLEYRHFSDRDWVRLRYRSMFWINQENAIYQEVFYESHRAQVTEWRLGAQYVPSLAAHFQFIIRPFVVLRPEQKSHFNLLLGPQWNF